MGTSPIVLNQAREITKLSFRLVKEFLRRNMGAVNALSAALMEYGDIDGPEVIRIVTDNAEFKPEEPLHVALRELLSDDEFARLDSFFSEALGEKDAHHGRSEQAPIVLAKPASEEDAEGE